LDKLVYKSITKVQAEICKIGISKERNNREQGFKFRGIDDVYNALSPIMADFGLVVMPKFSEVIREERKTAKDRPIFWTFLRCDLEFVSSDDASSHVVTVYGEGLDMADKSTPKAMSMAVKNGLLQVFLIPTEGDNDADATTHDLAPKMGAEQSRLVDALLVAAEAATNKQQIRNIWAHAVKDKVLPFVREILSERAKALPEVSSYSAEQEKTS
jgi:hypothetical protein